MATTETEEIEIEVTEGIEEDIEIIETMIVNLEVTDLKDVLTVERRGTMPKIAINVMLLGYSAPKPR